VTDLAGVPLVAMRDGKQLDEHPVLGILRRPNSQCDETEFRRQLVFYLVLCRNAYIRIFRDGQGKVATISLIHPDHIKADVDPATGMVVRWSIQGKVFLPPEDVLHIRDVSWSNTIDGIYGASVIQTIDLGIQVDLDTRRQAGKAARRGRLEMLVRPKDIHGTLGKTSAKRIKDEYEEITQSGDGLWVIGKAMEATPLSLTMRDLEFEKLLTMTRDEVISLFGVPPVRIGLPGANYGTARQQMRTYWETLRHWARLIDEKLSRLADDGATIHHDLTDVEALQTSRTERQMRASVWVTGFGVTPAEAARYEGFMDAPIPEGNPADMRAPRRPPSEVVEPQEAGIALAPVLQRWSCSYQALALEGEIPEGAELCLKAELVTHLGVERGAKAAGLIHGAVAEYVRHADADAVLGVRQLRCFGPDMIQAITMEAA
jgi:HK97 family phage portal protein